MICGSMERSSDRRIVGPDASDRAERSPRFAVRAWKAPQIRHFELAKTLSETGSMNDSSSGDFVGI